MSFRLKTILGVALIEALLLFLLIWSGLSYIESSNQREFTQRAQATVKSFAVTTKDPVIATDLASLESFVTEVMSYPGVVYARVRDADGQVLAETGDARMLGMAFAADSRIADVDDGVYDSFAVIEEAGMTFGQVELGLSVTALQTVLSDARRYSIVIALVEMGLVALFSFVLGSYLTRQLANLAYGAKRIADGELGHQVPIQGQDELAATAEAFNRMSLEVQRSYQQLAERELNLRTVLDSTHDAIIVTDDHGVVQSFNKGAEAMFGRAAEDMLGKNVSLLVSSPHRERHDDYLRAYRKTGVSHILGREREFEAERADGRRFPIALRINEMPGFDGCHFIGVVHDITERKQKESALKQAKELAEEAAAAKSQFLANMSHEIRTPMHGVLGSLEMLRDTPLSRAQTRYLDTANSSAEVLLTVIDEILDFSRLEAGKLRIEQLDFDPRKAVEDVTTMLGQRAFDKGLEVISFIDPQIPERLKGDPIRLRQVLINLVGNALKFTEHGEVVVNVTIAERRNGELPLRFEVRDTGIGIPEPKQATLFEPFLQADGGISRRFGGTGLGLSISSKLVELMGGEIGVKSAPGEGSTFWFELPFRQAAQQRQEQVADFAGRRILVVDDNTTNRIILHRYLAGWGSSPGSAADGEEALAKMSDSAGSGQPYDLAILDYHMPGMNGAELSRLIHEDDLLQDTRLIMVSSEGYSEKLEAELDVDIWLTKPLRQSDLHDAIATIFGDLRRRASEDAAPVASKGVNFDGESVLLVEDNRVSQALAREMLRRRGLEVQSANNGLQAVEMATQGGFDIILMDVQMPEMDGFEATRRILQWERKSGSDRPHTPIIALTAHALPQDRRQCLDAGMDDYLVKPYNQESLSNIIFRWLRPPGEPTRPEPPPVFDGDKLREVEQMMGDQYPSLLAQFYQSLGRQREQARAQIDAADRQGLRETVHKVKNNAGDLGAEILFQHAADLEKSLDKQQWDEALARRMVDQLGDVLTATETLLEELRA